MPVKSVLLILIYFVLYSFNTQLTTTLNITIDYGTTFEVEKCKFIGTSAFYGIYKPKYKLFDFNKKLLGETSIYDIPSNNTKRLKFDNLSAKDIKKGRRYILQLNNNNNKIDTFKIRKKSELKNIVIDKKHIIEAQKQKNQEILFDQLKEGDTLKIYFKATSWGSTLSEGEFRVFKQNGHFQASLIDGLNTRKYFNSYLTDFQIRQLRSFEVDSKVLVSNRCNDMGQGYKLSLNNKTKIIGDDCNYMNAYLILKCSLFYN